MNSIRKLKKLLNQKSKLHHPRRQPRRVLNRRLSHEQLESRAMFANITTAPLEMSSEVHSESYFTVAVPKLAEGESSAAFTGVASVSGSDNTPRHNTANRFDVNQDGIVTPNDALKILNVLNQYGVSTRIEIFNPRYKVFFDVNDDSLVSPIDVLHVINFLVYTSRDHSFASVGPKTLAIGNSLTDDLLFNFPTKGLAKLSQSTSQTLAIGSHLNCAKTLTRIWANPEEACKVTGGEKYREELAKPVDNVFLQPFYGATVAQEIHAIRNIINYTKANPANADTRFYLYATWGVQTDLMGVSFYDHWNTHTASLGEDWSPSKSTFDLMLTELRQSGYEISLIPAGHTFNAIIDAIRSGKSIVMQDKVNGSLLSHELTEEELWRDGLHASHATQLSTGLTALSAIYGIKPTGINALDYSLQELKAVDSYVSPHGTKMLAAIAWQTYLYTTYPSA
jgi:Dockerin type I domain